MLDLFPGTKTRKPPRVIAHMTDAGTSDRLGYQAVAFFECKKCGWKSGWRHLEKRYEVSRGIPCENCN